jgi:hypothetical protein
VLKKLWFIPVAIIALMCFAFSSLHKKEQIKKYINEMAIKPEHATLTEDSNAINVDSIFFTRVDSATKNWEVLKAPNLETTFQKQYSGTINGKEAFFNINFRACNVREQKDMVISANIGDTLEDFYVNEFCIYNQLNDFDFDKYRVFFVALDKNVRYNDYFICENCKSKNRKIKQGHGKYLLASGFVKNITFRFSKDSSTIEGFLQDDSIPNHFILQVKKPEQELNYQVYRYHKHRKFQNDKIVEVAATEVLAIDLPKENDKNYNKFLNYQIDFIKTEEEPKSKPHKQYNTIEELTNQYKTIFAKKVKESKISWSRSIIGGYNNSNVFYNQKGWLALQLENFEGGEEDYGGLVIDYLSYDITKKKFLNAKDVLINNYSDVLETLKEKIGIEYTPHDFAFVCADGIAFKLSGNHGWEYNLCFFSWKYVMQLLNEDFKKEYEYLWNKRN